MGVFIDLATPLKRRDSDKMQKRLQRSRVRKTLVFPVEYFRIRLSGSAPALKPGYFNFRQFPGRHFRRWLC